MSRSFSNRAAAVAAVAVLTVTATACGGAEDDSANASAKGGRHTVKTAMGKVKVNNDPKRVVVLDTDALDSAITLGVKPVGAVQPEAGAPLSTYLPKDKLKGIKKVGLIAEPNLEAIAGLKPDLILSSKARDEKNYQELSKIAPTVFTETTGPTWRDNFELHADALGAKDRAKKVEADYEKHVAKVTEALGGEEKAKETKVGFVRFVEGADTRLYKNDTFVGSIFKDLKVGRPANVDKTGFSLDISPERIDEANADVVFHSTYGDPKKAKETTITGSNMWKKLDAVKNKKVYPVNDDLWMLGIGYTGAGKVLDEMEQKLG
ncbi:ABC transporter substrate-binding protein [Streptomyces spirodelae]|uniref:Iron-siderophore ABC transporter substrate-binding protein n=1 Tax=Streptomyces spirodelae TaxID=2812904 RepID=A0ABS3WLF8_9ACTN|nr:iron-siderophore ABC transporter substrate-binding protein [Streptomyces spirodelae]MBO8183941.1 iron-siderophore ABC transporter substrate-binding protein [Streptomyces spirodelae]